MERCRSALKRMFRSASAGIDELTMAKIVVAGKVINADICCKTSTGEVI